MPNLEYLILPSLFRDIQETDNSGIFFEKLKGIHILKTFLKIPERISENSKLESIVIEQNHRRVISTLRAMSSLRIRNLRITTDSLTSALVEMVAKFDHLEQLILSPYTRDNDINLSTELRGLSKLSKFEFKLLNSQELRTIYNLNGLEELVLTVGMAEMGGFCSVFELPHLKTLILTLKDSIQSIHCQFPNNSKLKNLKIRGNLKTLTNSLGNLQNLESLDLAYNNLDCLPESIGNLKNLKSLDVKYSNLTKLPDQISQLSNLEILDITNNRITELPKSFGKLSKLKTLKAERNDISILPKSFTKCQDISRLNLGLNLKLELPEKIGRLTSLEHLDIIYSGVSYLPESIGSLKNLKVLRLNNRNGWKENLQKDGRKKRFPNDIKHLPTSFASLTKLQEVSLSENRNVSDEVLNLMLNSQSKNLKLYLEGCGIDQLPNESWDNFDYSILNLRNNNIRELPEQFFWNNPGTIYLSGNKVEMFHGTILNRTNLMLLGYKKSFFSLEDLKKREDLVETIMEVCSRFYSVESKNPILELYPIAFAIDSIKATSLIDHDNYAEALYKAKRYKDCIPHYEIAINKDLARCVRVVNFLAPKIYKKSRAHLYTKDTISAINELIYIQNEFGNNLNQEIAQLYASIGFKEKSDSYFQNAVNRYQAAINQSSEDSWGEKLSLLEVHLISNHKKDFNTYAEKLNKAIIADERYRIIFDYLKLLNQLNGSEIDVKIARFIDHHKSKNIENKSWSCRLVEEWKKTLARQHWEKVERLNDIVCRD